MDDPRNRTLSAGRRWALWWPCPGISRWPPTDVDLIAVEGYGWLLGDLPRRMAEPDDLLRAIRLTEREPSMLGASAHVIAIARLP